MSAHSIAIPPLIHPSEPSLPRQTRTLSAQLQKSKVLRKKQELLDAQNPKLVEKKKQVIRLGGNMRERKSLDNKFRNAEDDEKELVEMR